MFGHRSDGVRLKGIDPIQKIIPHIMSARNDAQNTTIFDLRCEEMDKFIRAQRDNDKNFNYMHILIAATVRTIALYPRLNRFVMNGRIYARKGIYVSFVVKRGLSAAANESTVKLKFTGLETIDEVAEKVNEAIKANNKTDDKNDTDKTARVLTHIPNFLIKFGVGLIKFLDKHGMLPKKILEVSPFHTTFFITNLKSIKGEFINHHLYDFGNTGLFLAMGKEQMTPVVEDDKIVPGKVMKLGINTDERFCDGFYYITSFKQFKKFINDPTPLLTPLEALTEDVEVYSPFHKKKKNKKEKKNDETKDGE